MDKLVGKQKKLDANNDGQISGEDFKLLREKRIKKAEGGYNLQDEFVKDNDRFILKMAQMSMQDVKNERDRDEAIRLFIQDKTKVANVLDLDFDKNYYEKEIAKKIRELAEEQNPLLGVRQIKQEGGSMDDQMMMVMKMKPMESDQEMEDNYTQFIMEEALTEKEEDMLMSKLEQDEELAMLFDKVIDVAQEFAGSGPVEGPGSGVSDSIPARLSDGEFVFTAKATEEIGADELMRMMKDAEAKADKRQQMQTGGPMEEETMTTQTNEPNVQEIRVVKETVDSAGRMMEDEDEISKDIKSQMMLDPNQRHVRS
jgi:hypothetical protein